MAAVQSQLNGYDPSLEDLPAWKKDLIMRKRANARTHGGLPVRSGSKGAPISPCSIPPSPLFPSSQQGPSQLGVRLVQGPQDSLCSFSGHSTTVNQSSLHSGWCRSDSDGSSRTVTATEGCDSVGEVFSDVNGVVNDEFSAMKAPSAMHHKGLVEGSSWHYNDEEELEYGPGIVSRLKNRYMSLAMREAKGRSSLRKYSSLEDLLDDGPPWQERGRTNNKIRPSQGGSPARRDIMKRTRSVDSLALRRMESNDNRAVPKSHSSGALRQANLAALGKEDIIIIETTRSPVEVNGINSTTKIKETPLTRKSSSSSLLDEEELPAPDIVKQVKQIFESSSGRTVRGTAKKVAAHKAAQAKKHGVTPSVKPALKAKPAQLLNKNPPSPTIEEVRSSLKQVSNVGRPTPPRPALNLKGITPVTSGLTPVTASVTSPASSPLVNGEGVKQVSSAAITNIRNECLSQEFDFTGRLQDSPRPRPHSPVTPLPPSPTPTHKVNIPPAFKSEPDNTKENQRVLQENKKNVEKSKPFKEVHPNAKVLSPLPSSNQPMFPQVKHSPTEDSPKPLITQRTSQEPLKLVPTVETSSVSASVDLVEEISLHKEREYPSPSVLEVIKAAEMKSTDPSSGGSPISGLRTTKSKDNRWHQQDNTTLVFNFSKRTETPDYIENDGVDLSTRRFPNEKAGYVIMPGYDGKMDSSTDGDDGEDDACDASRMVGVPPPPCNISFDGEGVIINGRSNLQRQPKNRKAEVSFDMSSTSTFEYPSENSLLEDFKDDRANTTLGGTTISSGGLASYTPSKLQLNESFELGISRSTSVHPPTPPREKNPLEVELQDHLRPADENETVTWSAESAPDMLF